MAKNIYALLVGIDNYAPASVPPIPPLKGCVNDIKAIEAYLKERIAQDGEWKLVEPTDQPWILKNEQATRMAIINGFGQHLCKANSDDVVLFYYAGHGAQEKAPEEFWELEADRLDETLVCYDSRTEGSRDLADKELAYLISQVAQKNPHVVIILDCCHSGSGTRDLSPEITVRRSPVDSRERPLSSFIFADDKTVLEQLLRSYQNQDKKKTGVVLPNGKHVMFSACRDYELAKEYKAEDGQPRGAFSYFLLKTLERTNGSLTYLDLARNINALVSGKVKEQSPQVYATDPMDLRELFLGGAIKKRPFYFTLTHSQNNSTWVIDGGALHGIPTASSGGDTLLAIFPAGSTPEQLHQLDAALGEARVTQVLPQRSKVEILSSGESFSEIESYWAVVTSLPLPPLPVYITGEPGEATGIELAQQALQTAAPGNKKSLYVRQVDQATDADYYLVARKGQYWITNPDDGRPLVAPIPEHPNQAGYTPENASEIILRLEHIARWTNILELSTPATSRIKSDDVEMEIILLSGQQESSRNSDESQIASSEMRVEYTYENGEWTPPIIQIRLTNHSNKTFYCNVLDLSESYAVGVPFFEQTSSIRLLPKGTEGSTRVESFDDIAFIVPDAFFSQGITEYKDLLKLIVSTTEFDASLLEQDGLSPVPPNRSVEEHQGTLNRLMAGVNTREAVRVRGNYDDWMTKEVTITIVRPQEAQPIHSNRNTLLQNGVVEVQPHPSLRANVNLTTIPQASRDLGNLILPPILRQQPRMTESFQFTTSRGSDPGLSALELTDVEDYTVVTAEAPLKLLVNTELAEHENLLALGYDGEFFLPLGRRVKTENGKTEITLERLPQPTISSRSLQGSIRIFFEKVAHQKLGRPFEYPILAVAEVGENEVIYEKNQEKVKAQVAQVQRIVLYIHGIIGDTKSMVPSIYKARVEGDGQKRPLRELYDLVLTFDYENLQTTIEENGKLLGQRLQEVGLGPNHGKELHIVAHSMGGLVSRWFIEREGGNKIVQHLVMLGTPNAGSPWSAVQDWVFTALGLGLNQLSAIVWPTNVVAGLLEFLEANDYSLDQMQPDSPFIKAIAQNSDPHVPYTIVAGDRSIVPAATALQQNLPSNSLQRLMQKLFGKAVDRVVDLAFFSQPNDIAVTLASIKSVSSNRSPQPRILLPDAACDHLTYFTHQAGLDALSKALYPSPNRDIQPPAELIPSPIADDDRQSIASQPVLDSATISPVQEEAKSNIISTPSASSDEINRVNSTQLDSTAEERENRPRISGVVIGVVALLVAVIVGLIFVLQRPPKEKPANQNQSSQALPIGDKLRKRENCQGWYLARSKIVRNSV
ncbi:peptidase C14 caspase catalytic subunit p20 [Crinalium epipsammum PCC 9333]|uniref:Peptidase C14 caspase catalytic subunit p20 n=1 Tax=Crinalium epipsammum PCC 9333 TaxID=1173022 RepID=K9VWW1_9CYAN|nr:caspase family protein [Crinalium epipsammum]AFZ11645.1 peptidase C14 caspase catalytic subunit p20 [Crinalium epipsammum PCC 9333]